ncbi:MAG TPA: NAD(P)H-dependent oxidoreductase [Flavisolibacter sp.]|nr:NAD(P)H-dependent oxidoreductase [Flavisolibacter sp.]
MFIEVISGSPRQLSLTKRVALHLQEDLSHQAEVRVGLIDVSKHHLPPVEHVYNSPEEVPDSYKRIAERIFQADAFILVTPEYNGSYSPAMKNLLDHFPKQQHKVFGLVSASPGSLGGIRAAMQLQQLVYSLFGIGSPYMLIVPEVEKKFSEKGELIDFGFKRNIKQFMDEFLWLTSRVCVSEESVI